MKKLFFFVMALILICSTSMAFERGGRGGERGRPGGRPGIRHGGAAPRGGNHRQGRIEHPVHFMLPREPMGGWRGHPYYWQGRNYFVWAWGPWAPWWGWHQHYGWVIGLNYYVPEGLRCYADNQDVAKVWQGQESYYSSDDAIDSALGYCENDPDVIATNNQSHCVIRNCVRW